MKTLKYNIWHAVAVMLITTGAISCNENNPDPEASSKQMAFTFSHPDATKATESAFEQGDCLGLYIAESGKPLEISGNIINNEPLTFSGTTWESSRKLYWDNGVFNAYAYYPRIAKVESINDLQVEINSDQREQPEAQDALDGYESSDFLYASAKGISASASPVVMQFRHIMSKITIRLVKGPNYEGEIPEKATVYIHNTVTQGTIDLESGIATVDTRAPRKTVMARQVDATSYTGILMPQRLANRVPLIEVVMGGVSYLYESKFLFKPGINHLVNLIVDKNPEQLKIEIGGEIVKWNNE